MSRPQDPRKETTPVALTLKQQRFVEEYLIDLNATQAAIRTGYSAKTAEVQGPRLLGNVRVSAAIADGVKVQNERLGLTASAVREQNAYIALGDPIDVVDECGNLLPLRQMPRRIRCAIRSIEVVKRNLTSGDGVTDTTYKIQFWDKLKAIEMEYKHFGLLTDTIEHKGEIRIKWQE